MFLLLLLISVIDASPQKFIGDFIMTSSAMTYVCCCSSCALSCLFLMFKGEVVGKLSYDYSRTRAFAIKYTQQNFKEAYIFDTNVCVMPLRRSLVVWIQSSSGRSVGRLQDFTEWRL
jgi:hypothetical protein